MTALWKRWRLQLWLLYVLAWTAALLMPIPGSTQPTELEVTLRFAFGKTLHICAYALMAALTAWLRAPMRWRFVLMFFLMVHGTLTEMLQLLKFINRGGELFDVALDNAGIAIGMLCTWKWWLAADKQEPNSRA
jgi:VanZ family protein